MDELAAVLALLAAVTFALAATLWQKAALSLTNVSVRHPKSFLVLLTRWIWLLGLAAQIVGILLQAAALDRGRVSIIQPLLVTTVIWALPLGYFLTAPALQTWATIFVSICVQALPFLVAGVALSAAITAFVPGSFAQMSRAMAGWTNSTSTASSPSTANVWPWSR